MTDAIHDALRHAEVRFQCLSDHFKEVGEEALWAMSEVDAERMGKALAATPAVGGEREALIHALVRFQCLADHFKEVGEDALWAMSEVDGDRMKKALGRHGQFHHVTQDEKDMCTICAAPPASPLRGREDLAPSPCSDLSIGELIEWLDNPQWTNGYLNSDAANHMSAAAELIERLVSSALPEQPATAPVTGRELLKITCHAGDRCSCADGNFQWYGSGCEAHFVTVVLKMLKSSTVPAKSSFGEPIREDNYMSNDLDKGDDA